MIFAEQNMESFCTAKAYFFCPQKCQYCMNNVLNNSGLLITTDVFSSEQLDPRVLLNIFHGIIVVDRF